VQVINLLLKDVKDEELVGMVLKDKNIFAEIIARWEDRLGNFVRRRTRASGEDVEDLLQNVFIKVYLNLNAFDQSLKFSSWIYRICYNEIVSDYRKKKIREHFNFEDLELNDDTKISELLGDNTNILNTVHNEVEVEKIKAAINNLDDKYKEVITMRFLEEKEYEEISDILQVPVGTVSTLIYRARKELIKLYGSTN
jgi:RNA polymerase sigma-70 factor (ECF subfamily)